MLDVPLGSTHTRGRRNSPDAPLAETFEVLRNGALSRRNGARVAPGSGHLATGGREKNGPVAPPSQKTLRAGPAMSNGENQTLHGGIEFPGPLPWPRKKKRLTKN